MLARRFTIVCLLAAIFGMLLAIAVAEVARPTKPWRIGAVVPCTLDDAYRCTPSHRR